MSKGVDYKGLTFMPGSEALRILSEKKEGWEKKLKDHLSDLSNRTKAMLDSATRAEEKERSKV